jgi:hypothetical protein
MATEAERTQIAVLQNQMGQVQSDITDIKKTQAAGFASLEAKIDAQDKKYASKWVQQVVGGLIALILIAVITALLALIIIPATKKAPETTATPPAPTTSSGSSGTPTATANSTAHSDSATPSDTQTSSSGGLVQGTLKQVGL